MAVLIAICRFTPWAGAEPTAPIYDSEPVQIDVEPAPNDSEPAEPTEKSTFAQPPITLFLNSHEQREVAAGDALIFRFIPDSSDKYIFRLFSIEGAALPRFDGRLIREKDGQEIAVLPQPSDTALTAELQEGEAYRLELTALDGGEAAVEVMLAVRGRCFDNPISLPGESVRYAKTIVRPRDVHWFSFTAPVSGWYSVRTEKTGGKMMDTLGFLFDASGAMLAVNDDILFPGDSNFMIQYELTAGEKYFVRISAFSNGTGAYRLVVTMPEEGQRLSSSVTLSEHTMEMDVGQSFRLTASVEPADALDEIVYVSSNGSVVGVEPDGTITALSSGNAVIWAMSYNGVKDQCSVNVRPVKAESMAFAQDSVELRVDERLKTVIEFTPANTSDRSVSYVSSDESVVRVLSDGTLIGVSKGSATVTAVSSDGGFTDILQVHVKGIRPTYRALVVGEQNYESGVRVGGLNTAQGVADMLGVQVIDGETYEVRLLLDSTRRELVEGVAETFRDAKETDISLIYINCHGAYENGVAYLRLHDETHITVEQLEQLLGTIPGKVIVMLDFCQSGAFIGAGGTFEQFSVRTGEVFSGGTVLTGGKYTVITSAAADQDSYRRSFARGDEENGTAAIMGRSLCEGAGWDIIYDRAVTLKADRNRDGRVTVQEIYDYTRRRVAHYLEGTGVTQTVYLYPVGDQTVIFGKK